MFPDVLKPLKCCLRGQAAAAAPCVNAAPDCSGTAVQLLLGAVLIYLKVISGPFQDLSVLLSVFSNINNVSGG